MSLRILFEALVAELSVVTTPVAAALALSVPLTAMRFAVSASSIDFAACVADIANRRSANRPAVTVRPHAA